MPRSPHQSGEFHSAGEQSDIETGHSLFGGTGGYIGSAKQRMLAEIYSIAAGGINGGTAGGGGGAASNGDIGTAADGGTNGETSPITAVVAPGDDSPTIEIAPPGSVPRFTLDLPRYLMFG